MGLVHKSTEVVTRNYEFTFPESGSLDTEIQTAGESKEGHQGQASEDSTGGWPECPHAPRCLPPLPSPMVTPPPPDLGLIRLN